jgi:hypothetical protein
MRRLSYTSISAARCRSRNSCGVKNSNILSAARQCQTRQFRYVIETVELKEGKSGGERGIRTLDRAFQPYNGLANRRLQPLGHLSGSVSQQFSMCLPSTCWPIPGHASGPSTVACGSFIASPQSSEGKFNGSLSGREANISTGSAPKRLLVLPKRGGAGSGNLATLLIVVRAIVVFGLLTGAFFLISVTVRRKSLAISGSDCGRIVEREG